MKTKSNNPASRYKYWSESEETYLIDHWGRSTYAEIAKVLGRTKASVCSRAHLLGIRKKGGVLEKVAVNTAKKATLKPRQVEIDLDAENRDRAYIGLDFVDGKMFAKVKFDGRWNSNKMTHMFTMRVLKNVDIVTVMK